ncbi:hypothetical protein Q8W71_30955 [Methylobacterium sp. NEAU 140]|uniref:hypothetical protein n=1 Tax=Methylobacterium sp. NEAU 140 TaxID=3064945 RepID=UPI002733292C|nr:hypothetical protein [Methylobacterium sp. NEAU 140]MDP4027012.1 hypothetical protein [Methylobacterium sp. NEAU 140]
MAGAIATFILMANGIGALGYWAYTYWPPSWTEAAKDKIGHIPTSAQAAVGQKETAQPKGELDNKTLYAHLFYKESGRVQTFKVLFHDQGRYYTADIIDMTPNNQVKGTAFMQGEGLVINYASLPANRPGYGSFVLQRRLTSSNDDPIVFSGAALIHDCGCSDNSIRFNGPIWNVPVVLTSQNQPTIHEKEIGLRKDTGRAVGIMPAELSDTVKQ